MSLGGIASDLMLASTELAEVGNGYVVVADCYDDADKNFETTDELLQGVSEQSVAVRGLVIQAMDGFVNVREGIIKAKTQASEAAEVTARAGEGIVALDLELQSPIGRIVQTTEATSDPCTLQVRAAAETLVARAAVEEAAPAALATGALRDSIDADSERLMKISSLLLTLRDELSMLIPEINGYGQVNDAAKSITAEANGSTAESNAAVASLSKESAEAAYGLI